MRTVETTFYQYDELTEAAKQRAVQCIGDKMRGPWWEPEPVAEVIVSAFAQALASPGWDSFGVSDFPGIDGCALSSWDLYPRSVAFRGTLTRENAPALPWTDGLAEVVLTDERDWCRVEVRTDWMEDYSDESPDTDPAEVAAAIMEEAVRSALSSAIGAGADEDEYQSSDAAVIEAIECNAWEFTEDGELA